MQANTGISGQG